MSKEYDLFASEERVISLFESRIVEDRAFPKDEVEFLLGEYKKLFKNTRRLVRMSDRREKELNKLNAEMKDKNKLLNLLSQRLSRYISPQLAEGILQGGQDVKLESKRKKLTVFFSDLVGFAEVADRLESEELTEHLNRYLEEMTSIALEYGATIDKYMGDAIMIFFGDPSTKGVKEDALSCVKMAMDMKKRLRELIKSESLLPFETRMGINTGYCTVGNFGSDNRMDYTIIGKEVNIASRLEGVAKTNDILISAETYSLIKDEIDCKEDGVHNLKGIAHPVKAYSVLGEKNQKLANKEILDTEIFGGAVSIYIDKDKLNPNEKVMLREFLTNLNSSLLQEEENKQEQI
ncbi:MAG: adenylate/guanylate cyclase domain-containing protein [Campylobacterales bacterium]